MSLQDILAISKVCTFWADVVLSGRFWREFGPAHLTKSNLLEDLHSVVPMFKGVRQLTIDLSLVTDLEVLANLGNLLKLEIYSNFRCAHETEENAHGLKFALRTVTDFISKDIKFSAEEQFFLAYFLSNAKYVKLFGSEPVSCENFQYMTAKLKKLRGVHLEMCTDNLEGWANVLNNNFRKIFFQSADD